MNGKDLNKLKDAIRDEIDMSLEPIKKDLKGGRKALKEEIAASEKRLLDEIGNSEKRVLGEMGKFVEDELLPAIEEKADKTDIDRIERKLDYFGARVLEHGHRLDTIESLPTVVHELRIKK